MQIKTTMRYHLTLVRMASEKPMCRCRTLEICLENPMDGGAWWAAVHGVAKSQTWLSDFTFIFSLSCIGEGNGNPLQCSCLENPRGRRAWWAAIYGIAQSRTQLKRLSSSKENGVGGWAKWMKGINCMVIDDNYTCGDDHFLECTDIKLWYCISETHNKKYILTTFSEI